MTSLRIHPLALGAAGLIPFVASAAGVYASPIHAALFIKGLLFYGATILAFLGGVHWGVAVKDDRAPAHLYISGVLPQLLGFGALLAPPFAGLSLLAAGLMVAPMAIVRDLYEGDHMARLMSVIAAVFNPENWEFVAVYLVVGSVFAAIVYAMAVVSIPMILDRDTDAISAAIASVQVVFENTAVMVLWGLILTAMVVLALVPWGLGLLLVGPWLGHASWHAYRGAIEWPPEPDIASAPT